MGHPVQYIDAKPLRDLIKHYDLGVPAIADRTGMSPSALYTWVRKGKMPAYMRQVCRGLLSEIRGERGTAAHDSKPETFLVRLPPDKRDNAIKLLEAIGAEFRNIDDL